MAAVTGTIRSVTAADLPHSFKRTSGGSLIEAAFLDVTFAGTYASADNASLANVHTAIVASRRDARTYALLSAGFAGPGDLNGSMIGAKTIATSGNTLTCELTTGDMSTEWSDGALSTAWNEGVKFFVLYTVT
jgi:hypothetical protein